MAENNISCSSVNTRRLVYCFFFRLRQGSLGRALGRRNRQDNKKNGSTSSVDDMVIDDGHRQSENVVKDGTIV